MIWYAIRTRPNALRPATVAGDFTPALPVEHKLAEAGIAFWYPQERKTLIHHRTKAEIHKRFPLLHGYLFAADVRDWRELEEIDGIAGPIRVRGCPVRVPAHAIADLRQAEAAINAENDRIWRARNAGPKQLATAFPSGSRINIHGRHIMAGTRATVVGVTARRTIRAMIQFLGGEVEAELPVDAIELVA